MWWVLLIAVAPDTYVASQVFPTQEACELQLETALDKCWPGQLTLAPHNDESFFVLKFEE